MIKRTASTFAACMLVAATASAQLSPQARTAACASALTVPNRPIEMTSARLKVWGDNVRSLGCSSDPSFQARTAAACFGHVAEARKARIDAVVAATIAYNNAVEGCRQAVASSCSRRETKENCHPITACHTEGDETICEGRTDCDVVPHYTCRKALPKGCEAARGWTGEYPASTPSEVVDYNVVLACSELSKDHG